jgi:hypothetical protein
MPTASRSYCKNTSIKKMGFSQRSSCKAQGLLARTSKKQKGKIVVSDKYKKIKSKKIKSIKQLIHNKIHSNSNIFKKRYKKLSKLRSNPRVPRNKKNENPRHHSDLFVDENPSGTVQGMRFKDKKSAEDSIKKLKKLYKSNKITFAHMRQIGTTMEQRAKYHSHPTKNIKEAKRSWNKFNSSFKKK